ncbi:hypothetical protein RDI58_008947 [Solanum bulbocastanum]|uniref:Uncharacterized protein n=1 Tax=Solanum bulbocastanum TaxID=147425 RepID=A0AAN8TYJ0_SOLBU
MQALQFSLASGDSGEGCADSIQYIYRS